jgi:hypothetical protein
MIGVLESEAPDPGKNFDLMDNNPKTAVATSPIDDESILQRGQEKVLRRRAELGIKVRPGTVLTRELGFRGFRDSEEFEVKEASEASEESPSGDLPPRAEPLRAVSKSEIQNAEDRDSATTLLSASVEAESSAGGGGETEGGDCSVRGDTTRLAQVNLSNLPGGRRRETRGRRLGVVKPGNFVATCSRILSFKICAAAHLHGHCGVLQISMRHR